MSRSHADCETPIVVVRDRDPAAVQDPPRRLFGERRRVAHVHATTSGQLPPSNRYVFNLDRLDDRSRRRAAFPGGGGARHVRAPGGHGGPAAASGEPRS